MRNSVLVLAGLSLAVACGSSGETPSSAPQASVAAPPPASAPGAAFNVLIDTDGALDASDARVGSMFVDRFGVPVEAGQRVRLTVTSATLDTVLSVGLPGAGSLSNDDVGGDRTRSELDVVCSNAGELKIQVSSFAPGATGPYHLHAERVSDPAEPPVVAVSEHHRLPNDLHSYVAGAAPSAPGAAPTAVTVHVGDRVQGALATGGATLPSGEFANYYAFAATPGRYTLTMSSTRIDSFIIVTTPDGQTLSNDDGAGSHDASLDLSVAAAGEYRIAATSYRAGETGTYELDVTPAVSAPSASAATARPSAPPSPPSAVVAGVRTEHGTLASGDSQLRSGEFSDEYDYTFPEGTQVHIEATSSAFDTYLILRAPDGTQNDNDDQRPGDLNAAIDFVASQAGTYRVLVTSYSPGMSGAYDLTVTGGATATSAPPPSAPSSAPPPSVAIAPSDPSAPPAPAAAPGDATHVWVVSAGITDYPDAANHLPECANDARKIVEALHNQGLTTTDREFLLVDRQATREGIHHAIQQVASQIQPNDTFVFFWSGHGGQASAPSSDPDELTGHDQFIFVYDGEIIDNTMAEWIDQVHALTLFSLDSCYSGGFAKDVVHRPGVVGMFSSEADVTSAVALQFQAGGYLSHFLRLGLQGNADDDPHDGTTQVGELTHYVWDQWAQHAADVRASGGYQQLVEERGSVATDQVFWQLSGASRSGRGGRTAAPSAPTSGHGGRGGRRGGGGRHRGR